MGNLKDEAKKMDPLFPRLHISDADRGIINKIPLSQQLTLPLQTTQRCIPGSVSTILPLSTNNASSLVPATSSYHDASYKTSVFSSFGTSCGSTRLATRLDSYHSSGVNLNISLTTVKQTIETTNCQTLCNAGHLKRNDYRLFKPQDFKNTRNTTLVKKLEVEDDYLLPSLSFGNGQHNSNRGNFPLQIACRNHTDKDATQENMLNSIIVKDNIGKESIPCYSDRVQLLSEEVAATKKKTSVLVNEQQMLHDSNIRFPLKRKSFQQHIACKDVMSIEPEQGTTKMSTSIWPSLGDNIKEDVVKTKEISDTNFISGYNITPEEVSQMIGPEQYCKARRTIIQQQRVFQSQLFELHRLIKVQKLLAESPDLSLEDMKIPSEDAFHHVDQLKKESYLSFPIDNAIKKPFHTNNNIVDKRYNSNSIDLPLPSTVINSTVKQPPLCFLPTPANQWLVPVRSPSEGLVYKPYAGPCPPPVGLMAPVYGMPSNGDTEFLNINSTYNSIPTSYQQGLGVYSNRGSLFTSYGLPAFTKRCCSPTTEEGTTKTTCKNYMASHPDKWPISLGQFVEHEDDNNKNKESQCYERKKAERRGDHELPLFPTTPMAMVEDNVTCTEDEKIKVIKVIPHNPKLASQSAARIFQFIQEERQTK